MATGRRATGPSPRTGLSQDKIVAAALDLVGAKGIEGLTMSALAAELGVGTMTLYWYFPSKSELLGALASRVQQSLAAGEAMSSPEWDEALFAYFAHLRRELLQTPSLANLLITHGRLATSGESAAPILDRLEEQLGSMVAAGIPLPDAVSGLETLSQYALGFTMREASRTTTTRQSKVWRDAIAEAGGTERYELVGEAVDALAKPGGDALFEEGLRIILDGIRKRAEPAGGRA